MQGAAWPFCQKAGGPFAMTTIATYHVRMVNGRATASGEKSSEALNAKGSRHAGRMRISPSACSLAVA